MPKKVDRRSDRGHRRPTGAFVELTDRVLDILEVLDRERLIRTRHLYELLPEERRGSYKSFQRLMTRLYHETNTDYGGAYVDWPKSQKLPGGAHLSLPSMWRESAAGKRALAAHRAHAHNISRLYSQGSPKANRQLTHSMMAWDTRHSLQIGVKRDPLAGFIDWPRILANAPQKTQQLPIPFAIEVHVKHKFFLGGKEDEKTFSMMADTPPMGFEYYVQKENNEIETLYRFVDVEAENENQVDASDFESSSFLKKFLADQVIVANDMYLTQFNVPNLIRLFVSGSDLHLRNCRKVLLRETGGEGSLRHCFKRIPTLSRKIIPMPDLWTTPWDRAGYPPLRLSNPTDHGVCEECHSDHPVEKFKQVQIKGGSRPVVKWLCLACQEIYKKKAA